MKKLTDYDAKLYGSEEKRNEVEREVKNKGLCDKKEKQCKFCHTLQVYYCSKKIKKLEPEQKQPEPEPEPLKQVEQDKPEQEAKEIQQQEPEKIEPVEVKKKTETTFPPEWLRPIK